jgi:Putative peptidoglycan binding domain
MVWFVRNLDGTCEQCITLTSQKGPSEQSPSGDDEILISGSVGVHGANFSSDVVKIQDALNQVPTDKGGASPKLDVDGKCGPKTKNAIQTFQLKHFGWKGADQLIEPGKQTLAKLNEILGKKKGSGKLPDLVTLNVVQLALNMVAAAQANLSAASLVVDSKDLSMGGFSAFGRESLMSLLNKHFSVDSSQDRRKAFNVIKNKYDRMTQVFRRPGGVWGTAIFERDPIPLNHHAYTYGGGYFKLGQTRYYMGKKVRLDSVYLCTKFFNLTSSAQAFAVVHELAHFVAQYDEISDYAYNRQGSGAKVRHLAPELKILNAECYANFAYEARTGQEPWLFP